MKKQIVGIMVLALAIGGCATIMHGTTQDVGISSNPTGAKITIDNMEHGATPLVAKLGRKDHHIISLDLPGYQQYQITLTRGVSGWVAGNIIFGGLIGLAVDAITGGLYRITPEQVMGDMKTVATQEAEDQLLLMFVLTPDPSWEKIGELTQR